MAEIVVDPKELKNKAESLRNIANTIKSVLDDADHEIESMKSYWEGQASESSVNKFKKLKPEIETSYENIKKYAEFLSAASEDYQNVEIKNTQE